MTQLFLMFGYPGAGKSYFARQLAEAMHAVRLNGDSARHMMFEEAERYNPTNNPVVFGALDYAARQILAAGFSVVLDASHNKRVDRTRKAKLAAPFGITPVLVWVKVPLEVAKERIETREVKPDQPIVRPGRFEQLGAWRFRTISVRRARRRIVPRLGAARRLLCRGDL